MSAGYRLTLRAVADLESIADYTLGHWGEAQMERYIRKLYARFDLLGARPETGRKRDEIRPKLRSFVEGSHVIFYREGKKGVEIMGVLHQSMDHQARLSER